MDLYEEILGAGMAVRYDNNGVVEFVFLDDEDKTYRVLTSELDEGWREKLRSILVLNAPTLPLPVIARLLRYSWEDIGFEYSGLTSTEKELISEDTFNVLVKWVKETGE